MNPHVWMRSTIYLNKIRPHLQGDPYSWRGVKGIKAWLCRHCGIRLLSAEKPRSGGKYTIICLFIRIDKNGRRYFRRDRFENMILANCYSLMIQRIMQE
jgi:hypothetical protein